MLFDVFYKLLALKCPFYTPFTDPEQLCHDSSVSISTFWECRMKKVDGSGKRKKQNSKIGKNKVWAKIDLFQIISEVVNISLEEEDDDDDKEEVSTVSRILYWLS